MKNFYLVVGLTGSGKDTLVNKASKRIPMRILKSYTTRKPRHHGEDTHTFINKFKYSSLKNKVAMMYLNGEYYCATEDQVNDSDIYIVDNEGAKQFVVRYKGDKPYKIIYIDAPANVRQQRMRERGDNSRDILKRIEHDAAVVEIKDSADIVIENIDLTTATNQLCNFILSCE